MKKSKLTFNQFRGLDFRSTKESVTYVGNPNDIGFEEAYGIIKQGVLHPLPDFTSCYTGIGRLFQIRGELYLMTLTGIMKRNGATFVAFITQAFDNHPTLREIKPFFEAVSPAIFSPTLDVAGDQYVTVTDTMDINKYIGKHIIISAGLVAQTLYITSNDEHTIYLEGLIDGDIIGGITSLYIYDKIETFVVYDGADVRRYKQSDGTAYGTVASFADGFIEVFANRLFTFHGTRIEYSTFNSSIMKSNQNFIDTPGNIKDICVIRNGLVVFTDAGTYAITGTGYTSLNFPKISPFAPYGRVYPVNLLDKTYISHEGYIRRFTTEEGLLDTQYNFSLIPDTQSEIFSIERGVIFKLGHTTSKYGILNVEELQNRRLVTITNFYDSDIIDLLEYQGTIFLISGTKVYKESGVKSVVLKLNKIRVINKMFRDSVEVAVGGSFPATIETTMGGAVVTRTLNQYANQSSYTIKDMSFDIQLKITSADPIVSFNLYFVQ